MAVHGLGLGLRLGPAKGQLTGVPVWTPDDLGTAPIGWFDANDADTITLNGSNVSSWANKGTGLAVSQSTALLQPAYSSTAFNGKPVVIYDEDALKSSTDMTGILAAFFVTDALNGCPANNDLSPLFGELISAPGAEYSFVRMAADYTVSLDGASGTSGRASWNGALSLTSGTNIDLGVSLAEKQAPALIYLDYNSDVLLGYFGSGVSPAKFFELRGRIAEGIFLTERPTTDIRQKMEGYLAHKWWGAGSANTLPSGHPYKDSPPTA